MRDFFLSKNRTFEKVVDSLYVKPDVDIYITGSNAYMLSDDLATLLTGCYVEIRMLPLSFREFMETTGMDQHRGLVEYMRDGGLPYIAAMDRSPEKVETYLEGIYNTVIVRDIEDRQSRRETDPDKRKITDILLLKTIAKYLASVAEKQGVYSYFQVTADMTAQETFEREMRPFTNIRDNYEKTILTADRYTVGNYNGIQVKYLPDWLLGKE